MATYSLIEIHVVRRSIRVISDGRKQVKKPVICQAADSLPEMDRILAQLPKAVKDFMAAYGLDPKT